MFRSKLKLIAGLPLLAMLAIGVFFSLQPAPVAHAAEPAPYYCSKTYDPASLTTLTQTSTTITCPGVALGDFVQGSFSISQALVTFTYYVSAANTVTVLVVNGSAGTIDLGSGTARVRVIPHYQ